jgi:hypothetical protein
VSSIEPNGCGGEVNCGEEVPRCLVVAGCDGAELLELGEEILDEVAHLVEVSVEVAGKSAVRLGRDHRGLADCGQRREEAFIGIKRLVGDQHVGLHRGQEMVGSNEIMDLPAGQEEAQRVAERINKRVDLGAQTAARASYRLVLIDFFSAPALC